MQIESISAVIPSRQISNNEILDLVRFYNWRKDKETLYRYLQQLSDLLHISGARNRYWCMDDEKPIDLIETSVSSALQKAGISKSSVGAFVYCGIHKGFLEPAMASVVANQIGIRADRCFDVVDACMGWCTSLELCQTLFRDNVIETAVILSPEFPAEGNGAIDPNCFKFNDTKELSSKFAGLTMGEGVATTVLRGSCEQWEFYRSEKPEYADLCSVPLKNFRSFIRSSAEFGSNGEEVFTALGKKMAEKGFRPGIEVLQKLIKAKGDPALVVPHSVSTLVPLRASDKLGIKCATYTTFEHFGNLSTASIPTTLLHAIENKKLKFGDKAFGWVASAGMKFSAFDMAISEQLFI